MVFKTQETSQDNGEVIRLTIPTAKSTTLQYVDEENNETLVVLDLITAQLKLEEVIIAKGEGHTSEWLEDFSKWLTEKGSKDITPSQAWFIVKDVELKFKELKKKSDLSQTLLSGTVSTPSVDP